MEEEGRWGQAFRFESLALPQVCSLLSNHKHDVAGQSPYTPAAMQDCIPQIVTPNNPSVLKFLLVWDLTAAMRRVISLDHF